MSEGRINEEVLRVLQEHTGGDEVIKNFLVDLIYEESAHGKKWKFSKIYLDKIDKYSKKWGGINED